MSATENHTDCPDDETRNGRPDILTPSQRVRFLLSDSHNEKTPTSKKVFSELLENNGRVWFETARWIKFQEQVEKGGDRWSKPHVSTPSLHSLFELRGCLESGCVMLDMEETKWVKIVEKIMSTVELSHMLDETQVDELKDILFMPVVHQYEAKRNPQLVTGASDKERRGTFSNSSDDVESQMSKSMRRQASFSFLSDLQAVGNQHLMKKLPEGYEACNILCGEIPSLDSKISILIRLNEPSLVNNLTEVPIPTRFIFAIICPSNEISIHKETAKSLGTLMSDEVFSNVAHLAKTPKDILDAVDEFLDHVIVLPPTVWDAKIRLDPPESSPSQDTRLKTDQIEKEDSGGHGMDPGLKRTGKLFGGLIGDIKRKLPFYWSDFKDGMSLQVVASFLFVYFTILAPVITFGGLLDDNTGGYMGAIENLLAGAICGSLYCLFAGQPLTIIGSTGPVLVLESIVYTMCREFGFYYLSVRFWIGVWTVVLLLTMVATDASVLVTFVTRFTEECFTCLIGGIYIFNAIKSTFTIYKDETWISVYPEGVNNTCKCGPSENFTHFEWVPETIKSYHINKNISIVPWVTSWFVFDDDKNQSFLEHHVDWDNIPLYHCSKFRGVLMGNSCYWMYDIFLMSLVLMVGTCVLAFTLNCRSSSVLPQKIRNIISDFAVIISVIIMVLFDYCMGVATPKLNVPDSFQTTNPERGWFIYPFNGNPWWTCLITIFPAVLHCILLFMDQQITAVIVNRKEHKLVKGCGYHLDLFVLSLLFLLCAVMGLPYFVAGTVMCLNHIDSLKIWEPATPGEKPSFTRCIEQRVSGLMTYVLLGCSVFMTRILQFIPMPVLYGIFMYMGISSLKNVQFVDRLLLFLQPMRSQPDYMYLRHVRLWRVHLFTMFQMFCFGVLWLIKLIKELTIGFPLTLVLMVGVRKLIEKFVFSKTEILYLDDHMPEFALRKREDAKKRKPVGITSLHIPLGSGEVMEIPLDEIGREVSHSRTQINADDNADFYKSDKSNKVVQRRREKRIPETDPLLVVDKSQENNNNDKQQL